MIKSPFRKIFLCLIIFTLVFGVVFPILTEAPVAYAAEEESDDEFIINPPLIGPPVVELGLVPIPELDISTPKQVGFWDIVTTPTFWAAIVGDWMLTIAGGILGIAGVLLNLAVVQTVIQMGELVDRDVVGTAWAVARDFANIAFIFILLFIGFATILRLERYGYKALLARLIVVALLVNFSLFFTSLIIDVSNIFAGEIYKKMEESALVKGECSTTAAASESIVECKKHGLSGAFMQGMGLISIYKLDGKDGPLLSAASTAEEKGVEISGGELLLVAALGSIFILIAAFVFFAAAIMLIIRFVALVFLMILSPFAFVGMILPQTAGAARKWWRSLFTQAFFAPLFFLLVYMSLSFMRGFTITKGAKLTSGDLDGFAKALLTRDVSTMDIFLAFSVAAGFLIASLLIAKQLGVYGTDRAISLTRGVFSGAGGLAWRGTRGATSPLRRWAWGKAAGLAEKIEAAEEGTLRQRFMDNFPLPFVGRATRRGLQRTRASYTADVTRRQKEMENLRSKELDRRIKSASGHDFLALVMEKLRRNDLDEVKVEDLEKAKLIAGQRGMGARPYKVNRPDAGANEAEIIKNAMMQSDQDTRSMHRSRVVSLYNDDKTVKWGDMNVAEQKKKQLLKAWYERYSGKNMEALLQLGDDNTTEFLKYAAQRTGTNTTDPALLQKIAQDLRSVNAGRDPSREGDLIQRTESTIRYLESERARRTAGRAAQAQGAPGGGGQPRETAAERMRRMAQERMERRSQRR